ncbi:hypothetical protein MTP99_009789 [Tenebrio molitor]|nr:hypothetical protein MTP99_009789 [Tenebrio molitor]
MPCRFGGTLSLTRNISISYPPSCRLCYASRKHSGNVFPNRVCMQPTIHKSVTALDAEHKLSSAPSGTASPTPSNKHQIPCIFPDENEFQELTTHPTNKQLRRPSPDGAPHPSRPLEMQQNRSIEEQVHRLMHVGLSGNPPRDLSAHRSLLSAPMEHPRDKNELIESLRCTPCDERHASGCRGGAATKKVLIWKVAEKGRVSGLALQSCERSKKAQ